MTDSKFLWEKLSSFQAYDMSVINDYLDRGLLVKQDHPKFPISIYNYSRECQYAQAWDDITLNMRGTILDKDGRVIAKSFPKFFNMEEMKEIPNEEFRVYEKVDGSLGIAFYYEDDWHMASKGSFTSEQAIRGREMLQKIFDKPVKPVHAMHPHYTYLFEIVYKENRIVVSYDFEDLVLLARIPTLKDGVSENFVHGEGFKSTFRVVKTYDGIKDYKQLKSMIRDNEEGFVIRFLPSNIRMKIKGEEYVRLHKILTNFSTTDIWELLRTGGNLSEFLERVPDEFDTWVKETVRDLVVRYENLKKEYEWIYEDIMRVETAATDRKVFSEFALRYKHSKLLFMMLDGKDCTDYVWKQVKPEYAKPFWKK